MSVGEAPKHEDLFLSSARFCEARLSARSVYRLLYEQGRALFPDESFSDLFMEVGRRSVSPQIVATVMVLQRLEGLSDREAVDHFAFDMRWKYAAGVGLEFPSFAHTVLVDMRARLRGSKRPNRIFEAALEMAKVAGLIGRKRVLDSTALYDAVATQDTVTMIRGAIRALLGLVDAALLAELRGVLKGDDDYRAPGKPACDWDDEAARESLIDALVKDAFALLAALDGRDLAEPLKQAAALLATVVGQDIEEREGLFRIARRVAPDRVISVVDPEARHGHKTAARGFDGYKGHISIDPDSELIIATAVTAGNVGDAEPAEVLLSDVLPPSAAASQAQPSCSEQAAASKSTSSEQIEVYGDASYGTAALVEKLEVAAIEPNVKVQPPSARGGKFSQDDFRIELDACTVLCPAGQLVKLRLSKDGSGEAQFGALCKDCPLRQKCTESKSGRTVYVHPKHRTLDRARRRQRDAKWKARYRATRPKVERKLAHMMRRKHGGRRARVRGRLRIGHDFSLLAAAINLARLAFLGVSIGAARLG
jgi:hypothetical protein